MTTKLNNLEISNDKLMTELYYCQEIEQVTHKLGRMFEAMIRRSVGRKWYKSLTDNEDMIIHVLTQVLPRFKDFNFLASGNPFGFYMSIINTELHTYIKLRYEDKTSNSRS